DVTDMTHRIPTHFRQTDGTWRHNMWSVEEVSNLCYRDIKAMGNAFAVGDVIVVAFDKLPTIRNLLQAWSESFNWATATHKFPRLLTGSMTHIDRQRDIV